MELTPREREVMHLVAIECLSNQQIAAQFKISKRPVELRPKVTGREAAVPFSMRV